MQQLKKHIKTVLPPDLREVVANFYHFLQAVMANIRYGFPARGKRVVMITGTNGKTTTAAHVAQMLVSAGYKVGANTTAFYSFGGDLVPNDRNRTVDDIFRMQKMLAQMRDAGCEYLVLEVTSHALAQHRLWGVPCEVAVMTNLSQDHLDYHKTMERYASVKGKMFANHPPVIVLNADDEWFEFFDVYPAGRQKIVYGQAANATLRITNVVLQRNSSNITLQRGEEQLNLQTNLPGKFNVYNATAAAAVGVALGLPKEKIQFGIAALKSVPGRLERVDAGQKFEVFVDYAHTPDAFENVLGTLGHLTKGKLAIVFGATGDRDRIKRPIMAEVAARLADRIFVTDEESYSEDPAVIRAEILQGITTPEAKTKTTEIADRREAIAAAFKQAKPGDIVLLAGMGHELFRNMGEQKMPWNDAQVAREEIAKLTKK